MKRLLEVQQKLKVPKNQANEYGGYKYRSCEDILETVKPLLKEQGLILTISDEIILLETRFYVKATASIYDETGKEIHKVYGMAREPENKKGMDEAQITGATSSYARKYALNGLFCIDDQKDADATNKHGKDEKTIEKVIEEKEIELVCKNCGKKISKGAYTNWNGLCSSCYKASKEQKNA